MSRRIKPKPAIQDSIDGLTAKIEEFVASAGRRFASQESLDHLAGKVDAFVLRMDRFALGTERRLAQTASNESIGTLEAKLDRHVASMDRAAGELLDNRRSLIVYDAMLGDHRRTLESYDRRLNALESRQPPTGP